MTLNNMIILIGDETPNKVSLLEQLRTDCNLFIPRRVTTNSDFDAYPSIYEVIGEDDVSKYINDGAVRSMAYQDSHLSFNISPEIGTSIAKLYNGDIPAIVLNADTKELGYYLKMYPTATILGYTETLEDMELFKKLSLDTITIEDIINNIAFTKLLSYIKPNDNTKTKSI